MAVGQPQAFTYVEKIVAIPAGWMVFKNYTVIHFILLLFLFLHGRVQVKRDVC